MTVQANHIGMFACHAFKKQKVCVWRVTNEGMKPLIRPNNLPKSDEKEIHSNAIAQNSLPKSLSIGVFNRVYSLKSAHEIWDTLKELQKGTKNVMEPKYFSIKEAFNSFKILSNELANDMYLHLNVIANVLNEIGLTKLSNENI